MATAGCLIWGPLYHLGRKPAPRGGIIAQVCRAVQKHCLAVHYFLLHMHWHMSWADRPY